jgi:multidrug efflux pump subunit AcrA (membrane-fusion protein)
VASEESRAAAVFQNERRRSAAELAVTSETVRESHLILRSPISGSTLTSRVEDLQGRFVRAGTTLAEVGDCRRLVADLPVSERLLDELSVGEPVHALSRGRPFGQIRGTIERISSATSSPPSTSSGLADPPAPTVETERFVARAVFDNSDGQLRPGDLVRAKIVGRRASFFERGWRVVSRWFRAIVW